MCVYIYIYIYIPIERREDVGERREERGGRTIKHKCQTELLDIITIKHNVEVQRQRPYQEHLEV